MTDKNKILDRIVKLFKLGGEFGGTNTHEAEMMSAVTKARQLMTEHNISMADLHGITDKESAARIEYNIRSNTAYTRKIRDLADYDKVVAMAIEYLFGVKALYYSGRHNWGTSSIRFIGEEVDTAIAVQVFHIILTAVRRHTRARYGGGNTWGISHTSYALGYAERIRTRAREASMEKGSETAALVVWSKNTAINKWIADNTESAKEDRKQRDKKFDRAAFSRGYENGQHYDINFRNTVKGE